MFNIDMLNLQLFADGGADGGADGAAGGNAVDAGQSRLLELGVPADKIRKRAKNNPVQLPKGAVANAPQSGQQSSEQDAAAKITEEPETEEKPKSEEAPKRMTWDEIMADPEYNKEMQAVMKARIKTEKSAEEALSKLAPALEVLARKHNLDMENIDYDALSKAIHDDDAYYEDKALEMGVDLGTAKKIDQDERGTAREEREKERTIEQQRIIDHIKGLEAQGEAMKAVFPNFDLATELKNPAFARMTSPNVGVSVEDAYYAVHRKELQTAAMQVTAQKTAEHLSNAIQAGSRRPVENGTSGQAASVSKFDYRNASPEQRAALKQRIREAAARGEKLYPGS